MIFKAILRNNKPGYGQVTVPFPIPDSEYDHTIALLEDMDIGSPTAQDCRVDGLDGSYPILDQLVTQTVNVDELDFVGASFISLASAFGESLLISLLLLSKSKPLRWVSIWLPLKRLASFFQSEDIRFQAMASKLCLSDIKDFIDLTFCCQQATVITDCTDLERIGKDHALTVCGDSMPMEMIERVGGRTVALDLIQRGAGTITPYGVVYDNGMKLEPLYDGRHFPVYVYQPSQLTVEIKSRPEDEITGHLYLPCPDRQIQRTLLRAGSGPEGFRLGITTDELPPQVSSLVSPDRDGLEELNALCRAIAPLNAEQREKLDAVVLLARPECASEVCQLAENLDQFDFVPKSDRPEADSALTELGYVAYHGSLTLEELMRDNPAEQYQQEQEMGGMA